MNGWWNRSAIRLFLKDDLWNSALCSLIVYPDLASIREAFRKTGGNR